MGIIQNQQESRSELQQRIAAELRAKAQQNSKIESKPGDAVEDSAYVQGYKRTTTLAPVWALIFFAVIVVFIYFVMQASN